MSGPSRPSRTLPQSGAGAGRSADVYLRDHTERVTTLSRAREEMHRNEERPGKSPVRTNRLVNFLLDVLRSCGEVVNRVKAQSDRPYARTFDGWSILSEKYGLVHPDSEIKPYDCILLKLPKADRL